MPKPPQRSTAAPNHDARRIALAESMRDGLWFIPLCMIVGAWVLSLLLTRYDRSEHRPPFGFRGDATSAQDLLTTVAAATLTMTTLVVSITIVALQLASQQFSPRVMRTFFRDRGTKVALGVFLGTTVYAMLVLRVVTPESARDTEFVPASAVSAAFFLMLASLAAFLYYLHHVAHSIRAVYIMDSVAAETRAAISGTYAAIDALGPEEWPTRPPDLILTSEQPPGALVTIDEDDLLDLAEARRVRIRLLPYVGDYLPSGAPLAEVWSDDATTPAIAPAELVRLLGLGRERTMRQDVAFGFRQLVDMADKALSPAINDPTTAIQALDRIHDLLRRLAAAPEPCGLHRDHDGLARVIIPVHSWEHIVQLAFDEIRHYGSPSLPVHRRMRAVLDDLLLAVGDDPVRQAPLQEQLTLLERAALRHFPDAEDRSRLNG